MKSNPYYYIEGEIAQAEREGNLQLADGLRRSLERMKNKTRAQRRALGRSIVRRTVTSDEYVERLVEDTLPRLLRQTRP